MVDPNADTPLDGVLVDAVGLGARITAGLAAGVLGLALVAEVLRRRDRADRFLTLTDALLPGAARTAAVGLLALVTMLGATRPASADDTVRGWLGRATPSPPSSLPGPVVTPEVLEPKAESAPTPRPTGPPVLIPSTQTTSPARPPVPAPAPPTPPPPSPPSPPTDLPVYVVRPDDCLWAIAARQLGPRADPRSIDAGWRLIYAINRAAVGDDPSLIHPGLALRLPPLAVQP